MWYFIINDILTVMRFKYRYCQLFYCDNHMIFYYLFSLNSINQLKINYNFWLLILLLYLLLWLLLLLQVRQLHQVDADSIEECLTTAIESGYRLIDCAAVYGNEKEVGVVLEKLMRDGKVKREELYVVSKVRKRWRYVHTYT